MFKILKKKEQSTREFAMPKGLTKAEQMQVREVIKNAQKNDGTPRTAQQTIPLDRMFPDGICRVGQDYYTKTVQFQDINYQLALQEDKTEIFEEWCSFLNFFDSSIHFELSFMNLATDAAEFEKNIAIGHKKDNFNDVRDEYSGVLLKMATVDELLGVPEINGTQDIDIRRISAFKNHPFKVIDDEKMSDLVESISENGILNPVIVRPNESGNYEMISGHRRLHAAGIVGLEKIS